MKISFYNNKSEIEKVGKSLDLIETIEGNLVNETDIINPTIVLEHDSSIINSNYMYIPTFGRYYFITKIESIRNNVWRISAHVDVLETYKTQIKSQTAIVDRLSNEESPYIADGRYTFDSYNSYKIQNFGASLSKNLSYILVVAGQN